ncbi:putative structural protein [Escherichia phage vB_EcoM_fHy-Eco03]|nr:putative structural protein [Escherichia phage vB_EcoM_fHy-Eco03]
MLINKKPIEECSTEELLTQLTNVNTWMAKAKADAETLRRTIKARLEADMAIQTGKEGTQTIEYAVNGVPGKLKVDQKVNRSLDQKLVPEVMKKLPPVVRAKVFKTKYELSLTGYRNLTPEQLAIVEPIVKVSPGIPVVTFTPIEDNGDE